MTSLLELQTKKAQLERELAQVLNQIEKWGNSEETFRII